MLNNKKISIIIPTYNRASILSENLPTFINQNYPINCFEMIIVDDGSTDNTKKITDEIIEKYPNIKIFYFYQKNQGPAVARNFGISKANGEIIAMSDDDCRADVNWLSEINKSFGLYGILGVSGKIIALKENITAFTHQIDSDEVDAYPAGNVAYLKKALDKVGGFDEKIKFSNEDNDLAMSMKEIGKLTHNSKMIIYDPPKKMNIRDLKGVIYLESEYLLYKKHHELYKQIRINPWLAIYWWWFVRLFFVQSIKKLKYFWKNPFDYLKLILLLIAQRIYLIILIPHFWKVSRRYR